MSDKYLGRVETTKGVLNDPIGLAIRPGRRAQERSKYTHPANSPTSGAYPPLSSTAVPDEAIAGAHIEIGVVLRDDANKNVTAFTAAEAAYFTVRATGILPQTEITTTIDGEVSLAKTASPETSLRATVTIPFAGEWEIEVTHGNKNRQHLRNSRSKVRVIHAHTDPASCTAEFPTAIRAGDTFAANVSTFDSYANPTIETGVTFTLEGEAPVSDHGAGFYSFWKRMTATGSYKVHAVLSDSNETVAGSPFNFEVLPAEADADASTHNIDASEAVDSSATTSLKLIVSPFDRFNNSVLDARGFAVRVNGGEPELLQPPAYSFLLPIATGSFDDIHLNFTLNGEEIANSPVTLSVTAHSLIYLFGFLSVALVLVVLLFRQLYIRISQQGCEFRWSSPHTVPAYPATNSSSRTLARTQSTRAERRLCRWT
jgi:hypothetical protein